MRKWLVCVKCFREDWKPKRNRRNRDMCSECYGEWLKKKNVAGGGNRAILTDELGWSGHESSLPYMLARKQSAASFGVSFASYSRGFN